MEHRDLQGLPKAHLHVHLTGSIRATTFAELGGTTSFPSRYANWDEFVAVYRESKTVVRSPTHLHRLTVELIEDSAADGAVWTEVSVSPSGSHRRVTGSDEATMEILCDAVNATDTAAGIVIGLDRVRDADNPEAVAELAAGWADRGVVGLGLTGDERASCAPFARAAAIARDAGLMVVPHSGELCGPESIREVLELLRPDRVMHGVRAAQDPALVRELADRGVCLDVCPSSNVALGVAPDYPTHPLTRLVRSGVACSLGVDDALVFGTDLVGEYQLAREQLGLTDTELADLARASLIASAAPSTVAAPAMAGVGAWLGRPLTPGTPFAPAERPRS